MSANQPPENNNQSPAGPPPAAWSQTPPTPAAGFPPAAGGYPPAGGGFAPQPPPPAKKASLLKRILVPVGVAVVAIVIGLLVRSGVFDSPAMKVGDCIQQTGTDSVKIVGCDSADAQFRVLGIVEKQTQFGARLGACKDFPEATSAYWEGRKNSTGTLYCLQKV